MPENKIFIPFIDRMLGYDCRECAYHCCQCGSGDITINSREQMLLDKYPYLRYFFVKRSKELYTARKFKRCWFLRDNGLCDIQNTYGYSLKPFICRLQPFYVAECCNEYIVLVDECPSLHIDKEKANTSHKQIFSNAREAIANRVILTKINWPKERLDLEKRILQDSRDFLGGSSYLDFAAHQLGLTLKNRDIKRIKADLSKAVRLWKTFLKIDDLDMENQKITYELVALTSLLRTDGILTRMDLGKIPVALLGLYFYMILFSRVNKPGVHYLSTFTQILSDISLGLLFLKEEDIGPRGRSIENRMSYLRLLQGLAVRKLTQR